MHVLKNIFIFVFTNKVFTNLKTEAMKGKIIEKHPEMVDLEADKNYAWCACGLSSKKTFCDGSHKSTEMSPLIFKVDEPKKAAICLCKQTNNPPYCDGTHAKL